MAWPRSIWSKKDIADFVIGNRFLGGLQGTIKDVTPVPHNGCRPPKRRRV